MTPNHSDKPQADDTVGALLWLIGVVLAALIGGVVAVAHLGLVAGVAGLVAGLAATTIVSGWLSRAVTVDEGRPTALQEAGGCVFLAVVIALGPAAALATSLAFLLL